MVTPQASSLGGQMALGKSFSSQGILAFPVGKARVESILQGLDWVTSNFLSRLNIEISWD